MKVEDGDYAEVYGFYGGVPRSNLDVFKITRMFSESKPSKRKSAKKSRGTSTSLRSIR